MVETSKLKILMMSTFYPPYNLGGDGIYIYRLCNELAKRGHRVDVVHCVNAYEILEKRGPKRGYANHENVIVHALRSRAGFLSPLLTQQTGHSGIKRKTIKTLIAENDYDVIHYHNMSLIGLDVLSLGEAIKLYTMHEHWLVCPMHVLWKYDREACTKHNCIRCQIMAKRPIQWWRYTKFMKKQLAHIDMFISASLFTKRKHHELGLNVPITQLPYFLPTPNNLSQRLEESASQHERPYFLFVGRLEKIKGLQNVIPVFYKYRHADLLIAGDGEYTPVLQKLAEDVPSIKFLGRLSYQHLQALYRNALAVIVPSICYEVFGIIIIESFAQGTPVIANNQGALPEVIQQSGGGFVYSTEKELIEHLDKFRLNPQLRDKLGNKGYQTYRKNWTEDYHIHGYYQLIKRIAVNKNISNPAIDALPD